MRKGFMSVKKLTQGSLLIISLILLVSIVNAQTVSVDDVHGYLGKTVTVYGKIDDGRYLLSSANQPTLLNMGGRYPNQKLTIVIYGPSRPNFGYKPEEALVNKVVYVTGKVELYKSKPQIIVQNPFEIAFSAPTAKATNATMASTKPEKEPEGLGRLFKRKKADSNTKEVEKAEDKAPEKEVVNKVQEAVPVVQNTVVPPRTGEIVLSSNLTLRGGPGTNFGPIGSLKKGTLVKIISSSYGWTKIMDRSSKDDSHALAGYVKADRLQ